MSKNSISVVGYPKSGNTWLTRLIARSLKIKVAMYIPGDNGENPELAADVNKKINVEKFDCYVRKLHIYPDEFEQKIGDTKYIVYIKRDPKAVFISSFFYFKYHGDNTLAKKRLSILQSWKLINWLKNRHSFSKFLNKFVTNGIAPFGRWNEHLNAWRRYAESSKIEFYEVDYNVLLENTEKTLSEIFNYFDIDCSSSAITYSVDQEKFDVRKKEIYLDDGENMTFGKEFNKRFLRSGTKDDWKNYLTDKQAEFIDKKLNL